MTRQRVISWSFLYVQLVFLGTCLPLLVGWSHLPERVAMHWARGGAPDGAASKLGAIIALTLIGLVPLAGARSKLGDPLRAPTALSTLMFVGLFASGASLLITTLNWDRSSWTAAGEPGLLGMALLLGVPAAAAILTYFLARRFYPELRRPTGEPPKLSLGAGERAYWSGSATNRWFWLLAIAALAVGFSPESGPVGVICTVIGLAGIASFMRLRVSIDERGVQIRYGLLGWPRQRIPLARIRAAEVFELLPLAHGGWGYRGSLRVLGRASIVVRAGLALRLELEGGQRLSITVDHADEAAKLINGFVARGGAATSAPQ